MVSYAADGVPDAVNVPVAIISVEDSQSEALKFIAQRDASIAKTRAAILKKIYRKCRNKRVEVARVIKKSEMLKSTTETQATVKCKARQCLCFCSVSSESLWFKRS